MFSWFRRKGESSPKKPDKKLGNPGFDVTQVAAVTASGRELSAEVDLVRTAERVLRQRGYSLSIEGRRLEQAATGFVIRPLFVDGSVQESLGPGRFFRHTRPADKLGDDDAP